jgi:heme oxygenase
MQKLPKIDSEGLRQAAKEGHARVSSVVNVSMDDDAEREHWAVLEAIYGFDNRDLAK